VPSDAEESRLQPPRITLTFTPAHPTDPATASTSHSCSQYPDKTRKLFALPTLHVSNYRFVVSTLANNARLRHPHSRRSKRKQMASHPLRFLWKGTALAVP